MIQASVHGRIGADPITSETKNGKPMCRASIVVDVTPGNSETEESLWVSVLAFGRQAEALARASKGEGLTAMGKLTRSHYIGKDGTERESWTLLADGIITVRSARPPGRKAKPSAAPDREDVPFDDDLEF